MELKTTEATASLFEIEEATGELTEIDLRLLDALDLLYRSSDKIAIKKLSKNDRGWAWTPKEGKQDGVYITRELRSEFFPRDEEVPAREDKPHIREIPVSIYWPQSPIHARDARYVRYTNKGSETHLTRLPSELFSSTGPASYLVMGRVGKVPTLALQCIVVDSGSVVHAILEAKFDLRPDFQAALFAPPKGPASVDFEGDELQAFIDEAIEAVSTGTLDLFLLKYAKMPAPEVLSMQAQQNWLEINPGKTLNPLQLKRPGDAVRELVSHIEFDYYRKHEVRTRGAKLIDFLLGDGKAPTVQSLVTNLVRNFGGFYSEMLNAAQQRKARVGTGFETHIRALLQGGGIPFAEQKVVSSLRPDFVLPNVALYQASSPSALVLSAKTTLRERWKQVTMEKRGCPVFLATMDEKVSVSSVRQMKDHDVFLIVPESFKSSGTVVDFSKEPNVLSFSEFFLEEIGERRAPVWRKSGIIF